MESWVAVAVANAISLAAGVAFGPVYAAAGRVRTWVLRILFLAAAALQLFHVPALAWFFVLWASFAIGGRIRRRIESPSTGPVGEHDLAEQGPGPTRSPRH